MIGASVGICGKLKDFPDVEEAMVGIRRGAAGSDGHFPLPIALSNRIERRVGNSKLFCSSLVGSGGISFFFGNFPSLTLLTLSPILYRQTLDPMELFCVVGDDTQPVRHSNRSDLKVPLAYDKPIPFKPPPDQGIVFGCRFIKRMEFELRADMICQEF